MGFNARMPAFLLATLVVTLLSPASSLAAWSAAEAAALTSNDQVSVAGGVMEAVGKAALHLGADFHEQLAYPFALAGRDRSKFILGSAAIVALVLTDRLTYDPMAHPSFDDHLVGPAQTFSNLGDTQNAIPLVLGFGAVGLITGSSREKKTSIMLAEALVTSAAWTGLLKYASGRERPREMHEEVSDWTGPGGAFADDDTGGKHASFPSGHATGIWAAATVLAHQYPQGRVVPIAAYGTAIAISYSRMVVGAHFLSDVVVGGLIGYGCARQVLGAHGRSDEPSRFNLLYEPSDDEHRIGLTMDF